MLAPHPRWAVLALLLVSVPALCALACDKGNLFNADSMTWRFDEDDLTWELDITGCDLNLITNEFALTCLADRHVVLAGDSVSRYMYLNLAYFLASGDWASDRRSPNEMEKYHSNWTTFFQTTNERMGGHEVCDCFRADVTGFVPRSTIENRYYSDIHRRLKLTYLQVFDINHDIELHDLEWLTGIPQECTKRCDSHPECCDSDAQACSASDDCREYATANVAQGCAPGHCSKEVGPLWTFPGAIYRTGVLHGISRALGLLSSPSADFVLNVGLWNQSFLSASTVEQLCDHARRCSELPRRERVTVEPHSDMGRGEQMWARRRSGTRSQNGVRWHWRTTAASADGQEYLQERGQLKQLQEGGWGVVDMFRVTEALRQAMRDLCVREPDLCIEATVSMRCQRELEALFDCMSDTVTLARSGHAQRARCQGEKLVRSQCVKTERELMLMNDDVLQPRDGQQHKYRNLAYWDRYHFQPSVYASLNRVLLAYLCL